MTLEITLPRLHPLQYEIFNHPARFKVLACGRRWGKSRGCAAHGVKRALEGKRIWWVAPDYPMSQIGYREIEALTNQISLFTVNKSERLFECGHSGGWIQIKSAHDPQTLRGAGLDLIIFDECAFADEEAWNVLAPTLSDRKGSAIFPSTPKGRNWFYDLYRRGLSGDPEWKAWQLPTSTNPLIDPKEIESAKARLIPEIFDQEYNALFVSFSGQIYPNWKEELNTTPLAEYDPAYPVFWGVDYGYENEAAVILFQERPLNGMVDRICVFSEYYQKHKLEAQVIKEVLEYGYPMPEYVYYDPAAAAFGATARANDLYTWGGFNAVSEGIRTVRRLICDHNNQRLLQVHPRCSALIKYLPQYVFNDKGTTEGGDPKPVKVDDHILDAMRYGLATRHFNPDYDSITIGQKPNA